MPLLIPPPPLGAPFDGGEWAQFFELIRKQINQPVFYSAPTDPGVTGVPSGSWAVWKNTTSGLVKVWANDGGVLKSVTLT